MTTDEWAQGVRDALLHYLQFEEDVGGLVADLAAAGAKIVPVEATDAMFDACRCAVNAEIIKRRFVDRQVRWAAMLAAAPSLEPKP